MSLDSAAESERRKEAAFGVSAVLLACFRGAKNAAQNRRAVERRLRRDGSYVLASGGATAARLEIDRSGRTRVSDPKLGAAAVARYNARSWTVLGLICGALAGLTGGHGFIGFLEGGLVTALAWGLFGAGAGALYGLWVGRATSARRLRLIAPLLRDNSSMLFAWTDAPPGDQILTLLATGADQKRLTLSFATSDRGPVLALD